MSFINCAYVHVHVGGVKTKPKHRAQSCRRYVYIRIDTPVGIIIYQISVCSFSSANVYNSFIWDILFHDLHIRHENMHCAGIIEFFLRKT